MDLTERTLSSLNIYKGKILDLNVDKVKLSDGSESFREYVIHNGGVGVLVIHDNSVLLVKQFRYAYKEVVLEIPAGKLNLNEDPQEAGKRELQEECGLIATKMIKLGCLYPTPGYTSEKLHVYYCSDFLIGQQKLDKGEFLTYDWLNLDKAYDMIKTGELKDAKTVFALLAYKCGLYE